jgi:superfamily II DNA or RNA helicase
MNDFSFQEEAADHHAEVLSKHNFSVELSGTGKGKTYIGAKTILKLACVDVAVVCPKSVIPKWKAIFEQYLPKTRKVHFVLNREQLKTGKTPWVKKLITKRGHKTITTFKWSLPDPTILIYDELHEDCSLSSQNNSLLLAARNYPVLGLSATLTSTPLRLMGAVGQRLGLHQGYNAWEWACSNGCKPSFWGQGKALEWTGDARVRGEVMQRLHAHILPERGHRLPDDYKVGDEYPAYIEAEAIDFGTSFSEAVEEALDAIDKLEEKDMERAEESETGGSHLTARIRENMRSEAMKCDWLAEKAEAIVEEGGSCIIFVNFQTTISALMNLLPMDTSWLHGKLNEDTKQGNLSMFQSNQSRIMVATIGSGSQSIDLHDTFGDAPRHVYLCPCDNPTKLLQALGRADRLNRKSAVTQTFVYANQGVEAKIFANVVKKLNCISTLNDGDVDPDMQFEYKKGK